MKNIRGMKKYKSYNFLEKIITHFSEIITYINKFLSEENLLKCVIIFLTLDIIFCALVFL